MQEVNPIIAEIDDLIARAKSSNDLHILLKALELKVQLQTASKFGF